MHNSMCIHSHIHNTNHDTYIITYIHTYIRTHVHTYIHTYIAGHTRTYAVSHRLLLQETELGIHSLTDIPRTAHTVAVLNAVIANVQRVEASKLLALIGSLFAFLLRGGRLLAGHPIIHELDHLLQVCLGVHGRNRGIEAQLGLQLLADALEVGHGILAP